MPDLKSELVKVVSVWDAHEQEIRQPQKEKAAMQNTGNMTRDTFEFVRLNPDKYTQEQVTNALMKLGYKKNSVSSVLTQMRRTGHVALSIDHKLHTLSNMYIPLQNPYKPKVKAKKKVKAKVRPAPVAAQGIAALAADTAATATITVQPPVKTQWSAEVVLAHMGIKEAHRLYLELSTYFGGAR